MRGTFSRPRREPGVRLEILSPKTWPVLDQETPPQSRYRLSAGQDATGLCRDRAPNRQVCATSHIEKGLNEAPSCLGRGHSGTPTHDPSVIFRLRPCERSNRELR